MMGISNRITEYGIMFLIVFTPLAFGSVSPWAYTTMGLTVCFLAVICVIRLIFNNIRKDTTASGGQSITSQSTPSINRMGLKKTPLNIPIILFIILIIFQLIPLSPGLLKIVSPNTYHLYKDTLSGWPDEASFKVQLSNTEIPLSPESTTPHHVTEADNKKTLVSEKTIFRSNRMPISIYPHATKMEFFLILIFIGMFFIITNTSGIRINRIMVVIAGTGFLISLLGILQRLSGTTKLYWMIESPNVFPFGPYINRNHFAGYICMVIPLAIGLFISGFTSFFSSRRQQLRLAEFQSHLFANLLLVFAAVIMTLALFLSLSRGGILTFFVSIAAFLIIIIINRLVINNNKGVKLISFVLAILIALVSLIWFGHDAFLDWLSDPSSPISTRIRLYQDTINLSSDFPVFGTGLGTFLHIYRKYKTLDDQFLYDHAHNDYLELLTDLGLAGFLIVLAGIVLFFLRVMLRWRERRDPYVKGIALGGVCGIIAILFHSLVDFNLHVPANALLLSIILGLTYNAVNLKRRRIRISRK